MDVTDSHRRIAETPVPFPVTRRIGWGAAVAVTLAVTIFAAGCATTEEQLRKRRPGATDLLVRTFLIEGNEAFSSRQIKSGLATQEDPGWRASISWMPLLGAEHQYFNVLDWRKDLKRITTFYSAHGYYNAQIVNEQILRNPKEGYVRLRLVIDEGKPTRTEAITIRGLDALPAAERKAVRADLPLDEGDIFTEEAYLASRELLRSRLEQRGYAYAELTGQARVNPRTRRADVEFIVDAGPKATFGEITIRGLETVPERYIRSVIDIEPGDPYSSDTLRAAQEDIYALEVFSLVSVLPAHEARGDDAASTGSKAPPDAEAAETRREDAIAEREIDVTGEGEAEGAEETPSALGISNLLQSAQNEAEARARLDTRVPIVIRVKEARNWNVRVGAGLALERNRQDVHGELDITSQNFFGGLRKFQFLNTVGYAWAPGFIFTEGGARDSEKQGVIWTGKAEFVQPWLVGGGRTNLRLTPSVERDIQIGYKLWNPSARIGVDRTFGDHITAGVGYRVSYYNFDDVDPDLLQDNPLGQDFQPEFLLEYFEQSLSLDYRNNPLNPTRGWLGTLNLQQAAPYLVGGEFSFFRATLGAHGYIPFHLGTKWVLALRSRFGFIYNLEGSSSEQGEVNTQRVPTTSRFDSGGRGSMRSFGRDALSIYKGAVPVGGMTQAEFGVEPRFRLVENLLGVGDLWGAVFADAASVQEGEFLTASAASESLEIDSVSARELFGSLLYGVGAGIWWVTPIGPVRIDFAYTVSDYASDRRFRLCQDGSNASTGGSCTLADPSDDELLQSIAGWNFMLGIGHSF
jgi:outer membrane protein assembly factor BamA